MSRGKKSAQLYTIAFLVSLILGSCTSETELPKETNAFIQHILDRNTERIYKSEIERVKVNYFPGSTNLIYSFWKSEKFKANGNLYLHLYPTDVKNLSQERQGHTFVNVPQANEGLLPIGEKYFYKIQYLQQPFDLKGIQTGQFNDTSKTWNANFRSANQLSKNLIAKRNLVKAKNIEYAIKNISTDIFSGILGPKVFDYNNQFQAHLNSSLGVISLVPKIKNAKDQGDEVYVIDYYEKTKLIERVTFDLKSLVLDASFTKMKFVLPSEKKIDLIRIGTIDGEKEVVLKEIEPFKLIYGARALNNQKEEGIKLINHLFQDNIPLVHIEDSFLVYLNSDKKTIYLVGNDSDKYTAYDLKVHISGNNETVVQSISSGNAFKIKEGINELIVNEVLLSEINSLQKIELYKGEEKIYQKVF